jgi:hypothetical protein
MNWWEFLFGGGCDHEWEIKDKEVKRPLAEKLLSDQRLLKISGLGRQMIEGTVVWLVQCKKCHEIKTIKENL